MYSVVMCMCCVCDVCVVHMYAQCFSGFCVVMFLTLVSSKTKNFTSVCVSLCMCV